MIIMMTSDDNIFNLGKTFERAIKNIQKKQSEFQFYDNDNNNDGYMHNNNNDANNNIYKNDDDDDIIRKTIEQYYDTKNDYDEYVSFIKNLNLNRTSPNAIFRSNYMLNLNI